MSGITFISRDYGVNVSIVRLTTTDTTATALAANYITNQATNIANANNAVGASTPFQWFTNDCILLSASDGLSFCSINSTFTSLSLIASEIIPLPISVANALTAHAGGGQTNALQLSAQLNRVTTVASSGDSVKLPASMPGLIITIVNNGANPMQVFGAGTDTINGIATATGVSQLPNSVVRYVCAVAGLWQAESLIEGYADGNLPTYAFADGLTAHSGGTQAAALQLAAYYNNVATVAAVADSVKLPASAAGMQIVVANNGANAMQVFGLGTDTINGVAAATGVAQASGAVCLYECSAAGAWLVNKNSLEINLTAGQSGTAGTVSSFPATASKGSLILAAVANTGNTNTTISNAAMGQASVISIPDPAGATADFVLAPSALVSGNLVKASGTAGLIVDQGVAMKTVAQAAVAGGAAAQTVTDAFCTSAANVIANWNDTTNAVEIKTVAAGNGSFVVTSTADPGASHLNYVIFK